MHSINMMSCFVDNEYILRKCDSKLREVLNLPDRGLLQNKNIFDVLNLTGDAVNNAIKNLSSKESVSFMLLYNNHMKPSNIPALSVFYMYCKKMPGGYDLTFVNWLELVHNMHDSLDWAYNQLVTYNNKFVNVKSSVDVYAFKALYPIVAHRYNCGMLGLSNESIYSTLRCVINVKPRFSKDYKDNVYERLVTSMKKRD